MAQLSPWHLLILAGVFVLLFGARKLPDTARALGRSMHILRSETRDLYADDDVIEASSSTQVLGPSATLPQLTADGQMPGTAARPLPEAQQTAQPN